MPLGRNCRQWYNGRQPLLRPWHGRLRRRRCNWLTVGCDPPSMCLRKTPLGRGLRRARGSHANGACSHPPALRRRRWRLALPSARPAHATAEARLGGLARCPPSPADEVPERALAARSVRDEHREQALGLVPQHHRNQPGRWRTPREAGRSLSRPPFPPRDRSGLEATRTGPAIAFRGVFARGVRGDPFQEPFGRSPRPGTPTEGLARRSSPPDRSLYSR